MKKHFGSFANTSKTPWARIAVWLAIVLPLGLTMAPNLAIAGSATLSWTAPTTNTDNTAITGSLTYNLYRGTSATGLTKIATTSSLTYLDANLAAGTYYWAVTAVNSDNMESAKSAIVSKTIAAPIPSPPTGLTVSVSTAWDLRYWKDVAGVKHWYAVSVGTAALGQPCYEYAQTAKLPNGSWSRLYLLNKDEVKLIRAYYGRLTAQCS